MIRRLTCCRKEKYWHQDERPDDRSDDIMKLMDYCVAHYEDAGEKEEDEELDDEDDEEIL